MEVTHRDLELLERRIKCDLELERQQRLTRLTVYLSSFAAVASSTFALFVSR